MNGQKPRIEVVVTGVGVISPIGIGSDVFWKSMQEGRSGIRPIQSFDTANLPVRIAGEVLDFEPKQYVRPRKSLKLMARDSQFAVAGSSLACEHAGIKVGEVDPDRFGVVLGADRIRNTLEESEDTYRACLNEKGEFDFDRWATHGIQEAFPLGFLKILPNMLASHISILWDARGPNNTIHQNDLSSLIAVSEATRVIERGDADIMITGGASSRLQPLDWVRDCLTRELSHRCDRPDEAVRPFDSDRDGRVIGEGAAIFVLERREHAIARGAPILARVAGSASAFQPAAQDGPCSGDAIRRAIETATRDAEFELSDLGHVNAHGASTIVDDQVESQALSQLLPDAPVTAPKSFFGDLGAASGAMELAASVMGIDRGLVPGTLNYESPDPSCPVHVVAGPPQFSGKDACVAINHLPQGEVTGRALSYGSAARDPRGKPPTPEATFPESPKLPLNTLEDRIRLLQNRATTLRAEFAAALVDESPDGQDLLGSAIDEIMARDYSGPHVVPMPHSAAVQRHITRVSMSNRERWILYPLLVLALGASLRTQVLPIFKRLTAMEFSANQISCDTLEVSKSILLRGEDGKARIVLSDASGRSGQIHIFGENGNSLISMGATKENGSGAISVFNAQGEIQVRLDALEGGGVVATFGEDKKPLVVVEHDREGSGSVVRYDSQGHRFGMLGLRLPDPPPVPEGTAPAATEEPAGETAPTTDEPATEAPAETNEQPVDGNTESPAETDGN
ncbi:unnamed protein product [Cladocopium goreaui]|uniref:beta-ketoacyl-[acyl-carrier-protein] synthase I n=1 Tax=Cladocopium goreaui TaxID=2562237 RepID=A0A9P1BFK0_9DINO|nr:unnamed protein product [Cladocopium goreaui]